MSKSIIPQMKPRQCFVCGCRRNLEVHHIMYGRGPRKQSERYGLTVVLCDMHHRYPPDGIHAGNRILDMELRQVAQREFEKRYGHEKWMETFGRNYLDEMPEVAPVQQAERPEMLKQGFTFLEEEDGGITGNDQKERQ